MSMNLEEVGYLKSTKRWLSPDDLADEYGFSKSTQSKMRMQSSNSTIPFSKVGGKYIRYDRVAIDKWLEEHQVRR
jgi:hypothetical protein